MLHSLAFTIARSLVSFGVAVSVGLFMSLGLQPSALERLKVTGPVYAPVFSGPSFLSSLLPPPLFFFSSSLLSFSSLPFPS
ncbi:methyl-accepting chemotaxis protein, partial [Rhizobium leguminosarum]